MTEPMKRILLMVVALAVCACGKEKPDTVVSVLEEKTFSAEGGLFMVLVGGNGVWGVSSSSDWIHVQERYYRDEAAFEVVFDSNESSVGDHRFCREGKVYVETWDGSRRDEVVIRQEGLAPEMSLSDTMIGSAEGTYTMTFQNNFSDRERRSIAFSSDASWISGIVYGRDGESVLFNAGAGSGRTATISATFTDAWGRKFTSEAKVSQ